MGREKHPLVIEFHRLQPACLTDVRSDAGDEGFHGGTKPPRIWDGEVVNGFTQIGRTGYPETGYPSGKLRRKHCRELRRKL